MGEGKKRRDERNKKMKKKNFFFLQNKVLCAVIKVKDGGRGGRGECDQIVFIFIYFFVECVNDLFFQLSCGWL